MLLDLPLEILLAIASAILGHRRSTPDRARKLTLARLAWSCRTAYSAYRPLLWDRLTLILHSVHLPPNSNAPAYSYAQRWAQDDRLSEHLTLQRQQVLNSTLFPTFLAEKPQGGSRRELLLSRIKGIAGGFEVLAPFVVQEGKLHLASLHDEEQLIAARSMAGIRSLWGSGASGTVTVINGLVLVPFPMHLVQAITVCELDPSLSLTPAVFLRIVQQVPSLFKAPVNQVRSLNLLHLASSDDGSFLLYHALTDRYSQATSLKYALARESICAPRPLVAQQAENENALRSLSLFFTGDMSATSWVHYVTSLHDAPNLTRLELLGQAPADLGAAQLGSVLFRGPSSTFRLHQLTHLVLDFSLLNDASMQSLAGSPLSPGPVSLPHLRNLRLSTPMACFLFGPISTSTSCQSPSSGLFQHIKFPQLATLELTLVVTTGYIDQARFPSIPFAQMSSLTTFRILDSGPPPPPFLTFMIPFDYFSTLAVAAPALVHFSIDSFHIECDDQPDDHDPAKVTWPSLKHVDLPWLLASVFAHTVSTSNFTAATFRFKLDLELAAYYWWSEWPNLQQLSLTIANDLPPAYQRRMTDRLPDSHGATAGGGVIGARGPPEAGTGIGQEDVAYPPLKSLILVVAGQDTPLSFSGFVYPNLERLTLDMHHPLLDGFTDSPLRYLTIRGAHACPRFVSQLLSMNPLDPNLRVRFLTGGSSAPVRPCSAATGCLPNPLRLRFDPEMNGRKWEALMHAPAFADWGGEKAVVVAVADALTDYDADLIVGVLARLLSSQSQPVRIAALMDPPAIADLLTEEEAGVFERLCGQLASVALS